MSDVQSLNRKQRWLYSNAVKDHFFHPRNFLDDESAFEASGVGVVGSPACGDMMKVWIKVDPSSERITDLKWQTFGCASAIASTSVLSEIVTEHGGMTLERAYALRVQDILNRLGGLPARKIHCSVLGDQALRSAINDYYRRIGQDEKNETGRAV